MRKHTRAKEEIIFDLPFVLWILQANFIDKDEIIWGCCCRLYIVIKNVWKLQKVQEAYSLFRVIIVIIKLIDCQVVLKDNAQCLEFQYLLLFICQTKRSLILIDRDCGTLNLKTVNLCANDFLFDGSSRNQHETYCFVKTNGIINYYLQG